MAWDFSTEPEFQKKLDWVKQFCEEKVEPLDHVFPHAVRVPDPAVKAYVRELQQEVKDQGLWAIFLDEELGGPGFGQLKLGLLNEVIGRYAGAPHMFGASAPDTGNMEMLAAYGTEEQKERWLKPLLNQDMFSAYSMTEPQGGSDPNLFKTHAVQLRRRVGDQRREVVHLSGPGRRHPVRDVYQRHVRGAAQDTGRGDHARAPQPQPHHLPRRAGAARPSPRPGGRCKGVGAAATWRWTHPPRHAHDRAVQPGIRHDVRAGAVSRESHGKVISEHQMVQEKIAESYAMIKMLRLFVLETAWKIDNTSTQEARTEIAAVKFTMAQGAARGVVQRAAHPRVARAPPI